MKTSVRQFRSTPETGIGPRRCSHDPPCQFSRAGPIAGACQMTSSDQSQPPRSIMMLHTLRYWRAWSLSVAVRSEEHTSELQSLLRISYAVFCLKTQHKLYILTTLSTH